MTPDRPEPLPFPSSLCHSCTAPIRYVVTDRGSVFMRCPVFDKYPQQPVRSCPRYAAAPPVASEG